MVKSDLNGVFNFLQQVGNLKFSYRFGAHPKMAHKESVAAHSWRLSMMVMVLLEDLKLDLNRQKCLELAIVHDIVESIAPDIDFVLIAKGKITKDYKLEKEKEAIEKLKLMLSDRVGDNLLNLWYEYAKKETREARFVYAMDKLETLSTLLEFGFEYIDEPGFIANYADDSVNNFLELKPILKEIKARLKDEYIRGGLKWKNEYDKI